MVDIIPDSTVLVTVTHPVIPSATILMAGQVLRLLYYQDRVPIPKSKQTLLQLSGLIIDHIECSKSSSSQTSLSNFRAGRGPGPVAGCRHHAACPDEPRGLGKVQRSLQTQAGGGPCQEMKETRTIKHEIKQIYSMSHVFDSSGTSKRCNIFYTSQLTRQETS